MPSVEQTGRDACQYEGCTNHGGYLSGYCNDHVNIAYKCVADDCTARVAAYSRSRCCRKHRSLGVRLLRKAFKPWA